MNKFWIIFTVFVLITVPGLQLQAQVITGLAASAVLNEAEQAMQSVIEDAENSANNVINNGAVQATILIYNFRAAYKDILKSTTSELDREAYTLLYQIKAASDKVAANATDAIESLNAVTTALDYTMARLPFTKKRPLINKVRIPIFVVNETNPIDTVIKNFADTIIAEDLEVTLQGNILDEGDKFKLNNTKIKASERYTNKLVYNIPYDIVLDNVKNNRLNFDLKLKYGGFFKKRTANYNFSTKVVPKKYAIVSVNATVSSSDTTRIARVETLPATRTGGSNWQGDRKSKKNNFPIYPSEPTNLIDIKTVKLKTLANRYGYGADIIQKSPAALLIQQHARSDNEPYGGGGKVQSRVSFTELKIIETPGVVDIKGLALNFNDPLVIDLPQNTIAINAITVKLYDGKTVILTTENNNKNFEVFYRSLDKKLFIKNRIQN